MTDKTTAAKPTKVTLTDKGMQAKPGSVDQWLTRPFKRGAGVFVGRITPTGERLFYFRYTGTKGDRPFLPIGPYHPQGKGGLTLADGYLKAVDLSALYLAGHRDLREHLERVEQDQRRAEEDARAQAEAERRAQAEAAAAAERRLTVRKLFDQWRDAELRPHTLANGARTGRRDEGAFTLEAFMRHVFPKVGDRFAEDVTKADLMAILDGVKGAGTRRLANVLLADLRQMLSFALKREIIQRNPLDTIRKRDVGGPDVQRERFLADGEVRHLARLIPHANLGPRTAAAIWLILAAGVRIGEAMGATWADAYPSDDPKAAKAMLSDLQATAEREDVKFGIIDIEARTWHLPTSKNQRSHDIHLSDFALAQLEKLAALRERDADGRDVPWLFLNAAGTGPVCVKSLGKQLSDRQRPADRRLKNRTKHHDSLVLIGGKWTAHDLRRTAATIMVKLGISTDVVNECLNHKLTSRVAQVYIQDRRLDEQARAFDALGAKLAELATGRAVDANVIRMVRGAA